MDMNYSRGFTSFLFMVLVVGFLVLGAGWWVAHSPGMLAAASGKPTGSLTMKYAISLNTGYWNTAHSVTVIDTTNKNRVVRTLSMPSQPYSAAVTPDGASAYITAMNPEALYRLDFKTLVLSKIDLGPVESAVNAYRDVEVTPDGTYVAMTDFKQSTVYFLNAQTGQLVKKLSLYTTADGTQAHPWQSNTWVTFSSDSKYAYAEDSWNGLLYQIDLATFTPEKNLPLIMTGNSALGRDIRYNPVTGYVYATNNCWDKTVDPLCYTLRLFDFTAMTTKDSVRYEDKEPADLALLPSGELVVSDIDGSGPNGAAASTTLRFMDPVTLAETSTSATGQYINRQWLHPTNNTVWAISGGVDVFDLTTRQLVKHLNVVPEMSGQPAFSQDGKYYYVPEYQSNKTSPAGRIIAINTQTYAVSYINVGTYPTGVFTQGSPHFTAP